VSKERGKDCFYVKENNKYRKAAVSGNITMESTISL
jgi:hypothetical protein